MGSSTSLNLSGAITGGGGLTIGGSDLILSRATGLNNIGPITLNSGRLFVQQQITNIAGSTITVQNGAILDIDINAANTLTNTTSFASGAGLANRQGSLTVNTATATFPSSGLMIFNSDDQATAAITVNGNYPALTGDLSLQVGGSSLSVGSVTLTGAITGTNALTKTSTGNLILSGTNTFTGLTRIAGGTLTLANTNSLLNSTLDLNAADSGTLGFGTQTNATIGGLTGSRNLSLQNTTPAAVTLSVGNNNTDTTYTGVLSGLGGIAKIGTGTLTIGGTLANSNTGTIFVNSGILALNKPAGTNALNGNLVIGDGIGGQSADRVQLRANDQIPSATTNAITINSSGILDLNGFSDTVNLSAVNGGGVMTSGGLLTLAGDMSAQSSGGLPAVFAGNLDLGGNRIFTVNSGGATFDLNMSSVVSGTGTLTKAGSGRMVMSASNSYTGVTTVSGGALQILNGYALGSTAGTNLVSSGGVLELAGSITVSNEPVGISGTGIGGTGALLNYSGNNTWASPVTLNANAAIGSSNQLLALSSNLNLAANNLAFVGAGDITASGVISGSGNITNNNTGILTISGNLANSNTGTLFVNSGTVLLNKTAGSNALNGNLIVGDGVGGTGADVVQLLAGNQLPSTATNAVTVNSSGVLDLNGFSDTVNLSTNNGGAVTTGSGTLTMAGDLVAKSSNGTSATITGNVNLGGDRLFTVNTGSSSVDLDISATVSGANTLTKQGTGRMQLSGSNSYSGLTTVSAGQLRLTDNNALGSTSGTNVVASGAALELAGGITVTGEALGLSGTGVNGTGALLNVSETNTWAGPVTLNANSTIGTTTGLLILSSNINNGGFTLTFTGAGDAQVDGAISGSGALIKTNTGTLILTGSNSYTGATTISNGVVNIRSTNALGTTAAGTTVLSGSELQLQGGIAVGAEALTINSDGVTTNGSLRNISGSNIYGGAITFGSASTIGSDAGVLNLSNTVNNGGFNSALVGDGDIILGGAVSGAGNLTNNSTGSVSINGITANTMSGALIVNSGTLLLNKTAGVNATAGQLIIGDGVGGANADVVRLMSSNQLPSAAANTVTINSSGLLDLNGFSDTINLSTNNGGAVTTGTGTLIMAGDLTAKSSNGTPASIAGKLDLGGNRIFTVNAGSSAVDLNISADISGANTLTKQGTGRMLISGSNSYTGTTTISGGSLQIASSNALGTIAGGTTVSTGAALEFTNNISVGAEALSIAGDGPGTSGALLNVGGTNSLAGAVTLSAAATIGSDAGQLTLSSNLNGGGNITTFAGAGDVAVTGVITNTSISKIGSGTLILSASNTYAGLTTVGGGVLYVRNSNALGTTAGATTNVAGSAIYIDGNGLVIPEPINNLVGDGGGVGALRNLANNNTWSGVITLADATATYRINSDSGTLTLSGGITESGAANSKNITFGGAGNINVSGALTASSGDMLLTKDGTGTLTLAGANTYDGTSTISGGGLVLNYATQNSSKLSDTAALSLSGVSLDLSGGSHTEVVGSTTIDAGATTITRSSGTGKLRMNTITRNAGGTVNFGAASIADTDTSDVNGILGGWATIGGTDWAHSGAGASDTAITAYTAYTDVALGGSIANATASNVRITGGTTGNIALGSTTTFINTLLQNHASNAVIDLAGKSLRLGTTGGILVPSGKGSLTIGTNAGSGTLFVGGSTTNTAGELILFNNSASGLLINSTIANNGTGILTLVNSGTGTVTLNASNSFTGQSFLNDGVLSISKNSGLGTVGTGAQINFDGGTLQATGTFALDNNGSNRRAVVLNDNGGTFDVTSGNNLTVSGVISGNGALNKTGAGTTSLTAANTYSGKTTVTDGTLVLSNATALPGGISASGGTSALTINGGVIGLGNGNFTRDLGTGSDQVQFTGSGGFAAFGADRSVNLGGGAPAATVTWNSGSFIPTGSSLILGATNADKTVDFQNPINLAGAVRTVQVNDGAASVDAILSGVLSGTGSSGLTKTGNGTLTLSANNTYSGITTVSAGTLRIDGTLAGDLQVGQDSQAILGSAGRLAAGSTLSVNLIGGVTETTGGTLVLGGNETVNTLNMWNGSISGSGTITANTYNFSAGTIGGGANLGTGTLNVVTAGKIPRLDGTSAADVINVNAGELRLGSASRFIGTNPALTVSNGAILTMAGSESVGSLAGGGTVNLTNGTLSVGSANTATTFSGNFTSTSGGSLTKNGTNKFTLGGSATNNIMGTVTVNSGTLELAKTGALGGTSQLTINTGGTLLLSGAGTDRINNSSAVNLSGGTLNTAGLTETVGVLTLSANSVIDLGSGASVLSFANSSAASWTGGTTLTIQGWSGSDAGGGTDQLFFGSSNSGLTAGQVAQISFFNPAGHAPGTYGATILGNGEVVPVPEPATWIAFLSISGFLVIRERKRFLQMIAGRSNLGHK